MRKPLKPIKPLLSQAEQLVNASRRKDYKSTAQQKKREEAKHQAEFEEMLRQAGTILVMVKPYSMVLREAGPEVPVPEDMPRIVEKVKVYISILSTRSRLGIFADHDTLLADAKTEIERVTRAHELLCQATEAVEESQRIALRALPGKTGFAQLMAECGGTGKEFWHPTDANEKLINAIQAMDAKGEQVPEELRRACNDSTEHIGTFLLALTTYYTTITEAYRHLDGGAALAQIKALLAIASYGRPD
ncbi:MAG: hypothetical protein OXD43_12435 [Bacteroidetes bacterium]|nr:hypothetical protein [Bacteroidota bacterium]